MKIFEDKLKKAVLKSRSSSPRGRCPDDETVAAFLDGALADDPAASVVGHLARCPACRESVSALRSLGAGFENESAYRLPLSAIARARSLDPSNKGVMEAVVRFAAGLAEVVKMSGGVVGGQARSATQVRGEGKVVSETLITFTKEFDPYQVEVDIEKVKSDRGEISIRMLEKTNPNPPAGVRVSLFDGDHELESALLDEGRAVFENLRFGRYRVEITRVGEPIGGITLEMKGEGR